LRLEFGSQYSLRLLSQLFDAALDLIIVEQVLQAIMMLEERGVVLLRNSWFL
jgi:phage baseplate assembly protein W